MADIVIDAALALGPEFLLIGGIAITLSASLTAVVVGWRFMQKII